MDAMLRSARVKRKHACENKAEKLLKYPRQAGVGEALSLEKDLTMFLQWPKNAQKKRNPRLPMKYAHVPRRFNQNPGSVLLGKHEEEASGESGTLSTHSFAQELVEEILSRLPVKSLARFSCVCKLWYHLIYSERFASLHISNYKTSQLLVGTCDILHGLVCSMSFLPTLPLDGVYCDRDKVASQNVLELSPPFFGGSFNGIVCLYAYHRDDIRLWNPATKDVKVIPKSDIPRRLLGRSVSHIVGLGFDPKTNDYKILQMVYGRSQDYPNVIQLELYSLRKNSWRKVDSHDFYFKRDVRIPDAVCSLHEYKVICALVMTLNRPTRFEIFLFDVSSEMLDTISIPPSVEAELYGVNLSVKVVPFQESIALGISRLGFERETIFNIWVLNDLYLGESSRSWSKLFSVEHNIGPMPRIIGICENHILYQSKSSRSRSLGLFDLGNRETTELVSWSRGVVTASVYKESIVRVWEKNKITEGKGLQKESKPIQPPSWQSI